MEAGPGLHLVRQLAVFAVIMVIAIPGAAMAGSTQPPIFDHGVAALLCNQDPGHFRGRDQRFPDGCQWQAGVTLALTTSDAQPLGVCVTSASGFCHIAAPFGTAVILREDLSTVPPGYVPQQNPVIREVTANGSWIINVAESSIPAPAADAGTLTIHSRFCPPGYDGPDYYETCHATPPRYAQSFFLQDADPAGSGYQAGEVGDAGNITFSGLSPAAYRVTQGFPERIDRLWVYCSRDWNPDDRLPATTQLWWSPKHPRGGFTTVLTIEPNADILCDFYAIPAGNDGSSSLNLSEGRSFPVPSFRRPSGPSVRDGSSGRDPITKHLALRGRDRSLWRRQRIALLAP